MYCDQCGIEGKASTKFCARCGTPLISKEKPATQFMHCPQCGKIYGADYQFCAEDGSKLQPQEAIVSPSQALPPKVKTSPILTIVLLFLSIFLIIVLAAGGYLYFSGRWMNIPVIAKLFTPPSMQISQTKIEDNASSAKEARRIRLEKERQETERLQTVLQKSKTRTRNLGQFEFSWPQKLGGEWIETCDAKIEVSDVDIVEQKVTRAIGGSASESESYWFGDIMNVRMGFNSLSGLYCVVAKIRTRYGPTEHVWWSKDRSETDKLHKALSQAIADWRGNNNEVVQKNLH